MLNLNDRIHSIWQLMSNKPRKYLKKELSMAKESLKCVIPKGK